MAKFKASSGLNKIATALSSPLSNNNLTGKCEYSVHVERRQVERENEIRREEGDGSLKNMIVILIAFPLQVMSFHLSSIEEKAKD